MLDKIQHVINKAKNIKINSDILDEFIARINRSDIYISLDDRLFQMIEDYEKKINALFIFSCLNFAFWKLKNDQPKKKLLISNNSEVIIGAISNLLSDMKTQSLWQRLSNISLIKFANLLNNNSLSFIHERWHNLREAGLILKYKYSSSYMNLLKEANFSAIKALSLTIKYFPSFDDRSIYHGQEVEFHKRAQVLLGHISSIPNQTGKLKNIDSLIGGADYRIPQLLRHLKILKYSKYLEDRIDNQELILSGSDEEIEIRAFTLWVIDLIKNKLNSSSEKQINAMEIDNYLWRLRKQFINMSPHHRTISIYY